MWRGEAVWRAHGHYFEKHCAKYVARTKHATALYTCRLNWHASRVIIFTADQMPPGENFTTKFSVDNAGILVNLYYVFCTRLVTNNVTFFSSGARLAAGFFHGVFVESASFVVFFKNI